MDAAKLVVAYAKQRSVTAVVAPMLVAVTKSPAYVAIAAMAAAVNGARLSRHCLA